MTLVTTGRKLTKHERELLECGANKIGRTELFLSLIDEGWKWCSWFNEIYPLENFYTAKTTLGYRTRSIEGERWALILSKYGLTQAQWEAMWTQQKGCCAACNTPMVSGSLHNDACNVDHCHETGVVRGLLCWKCNRLEGLLGGAIDRAQAIMNYLDNPPGVPDESKS